MQNTLFDPAALLNEDQRTWLAATMERNHDRFAGFSMEDDDEDDADKDDDADKGDDDQDGDDDADKDDDETDWKAKFEAQQRVNRSLERKSRKDLARIKRLEGSDTGKKPAEKKADGDEPDVEKIRSEAKAEAAREALHSRVEDKIEAKARAFADPEDAVAVLLRGRDIEDFLDGDKVDAEAIADALKELGEKKPHLLAQGGRFQGGADGGRRKGKDTGRPKSLGDAVSRHYASGSK